MFAALTLAAPTVTTNAVQLDFDHGRVTITRDEYGAPHVFGSSLEAVWFGVGYAQAQDRLWQAETLRRAATGTSAEIQGASAVEADVMARTVFGPPSRRAELFDNASPEMKTILTSFVAGVNAWITEATGTGQLPPEYAAFGVIPRPWTVDDTIAEAMLLLRTLGEFGADELTNAAWLQEWTLRFGPLEAQKVFADTHWLNDPSAATSVPASGAVNPVRHSAAPKADLPPGIEDAVQQFRDAEAEWERQLEKVGLSRGAKSNAIAISPRLSADGHALLLGGPQMGSTAPSIVHEMGIHGAGYDVTGMNIAGLPGIPVGVGQGTRVVADRRLLEEQLHLHRTAERARPVPVQWGAPVADLPPRDDRGARRGAGRARAVRVGARTGDREPPRDGLYAEDRGPRIRSRRHGSLPPHDARHLL